MPKRAAAMTMECSGRTYTRMPRVSDKIPDSRVDFHRCGNNFGTAVVSMPGFSHKRPSRWTFEPSDTNRLGPPRGDFAVSVFWITSDEIPGAHHAFALAFDEAALLKHKVVFQPSIALLGN